MRQVVITVPRDGISQGRSSATVETSGFQGEQCREATKFLAKLGEQTNEVLKDEYYETQGQHEHLNTGDGDAPQA